MYLLGCEINERRWPAPGAFENESLRQLTVSAFPGARLRRIQTLQNSQSLGRGSQTASDAAMPTLEACQLDVVKRPGDGACFFWSGGTAIGTYARTSFDLLGAGHEDDSPLM